MRRTGIIGLALAAVLIGAILAVGAHFSDSRQDDRATAIVTLGDSAAAGEGAGDYEPGTRGENGNWCHRSANALVHHTSVADRKVNLACSGADAVNVSLADTTHHTERSQARRLVDVAGRYRVTTVVVQVGADDDPAFAESMITCVLEWLIPFGQGCRDDLEAEWPGRLSAMAPKVENAVNDVATAMSEAGYAKDDYSLVLMSYASPLTERMDTTVECPVEPADARFARTVAVPQLSAALRDVAGRTGVRFLDLSRATEGREACSGGDRPSTEWQNRLTVSPESLIGVDFGPHLVQESFHPNARGHRQLGRCVTEFVNSDRASAACVIGSDGNLHARW
ncbi:MAG: GDSL-type esterase/lipase family protein [Actinophytocola sp.]|uniref:GDSL-type esterase/lipase family protein n=1 Tax=Actinophytocola sp. TaxID=1872138 RepID=UPI003C71C546